MMRKTGPNDARHVVWAIGKYFFFLLHVLLNLTNVFCLLRFYLHYKGMERVGMGGDGKNGPMIQERRKRGPNDET